MKKILKTKDKKAQANSFLPYLLFGIVLVFIFAIVVIPVAEMSDRVFDELKEPQHLGSKNQTVERINQVQSLITPAFDQLVFVILIAVIIGTFVIAIFTDYHPVVVGVFIIAIILLVIISGLMANAYEAVKTTDLLASKASEFSMTNLFMGKQLPIIVVFIGVISIIILLAKRGRAVSPV